jgi:hypothetical protein
MFQVGQGLHQGGQDGQENDSRLTLRKSPTARSQAFYPKRHPSPKHQKAWLLNLSPS